MTDDRGRFREVFCAVLEERGSTLPDFRTCDEALTSDGMRKARLAHRLHWATAHRIS